MPTVKDFGGFKIRMYFHDHNPPHVHIDSADRNALVSIMDGNVFAGEIDTKYRDEALGMDCGEPRSPDEKVAGISGLSALREWS